MEEDDVNLNEEEEEIGKDLLDDALERIETLDKNDLCNNGEDYLKNLDEEEEDLQNLDEEEKEKVEEKEGKVSNEALSPGIIPENHVGCEIPETGEIAEIVLISTSLSSIRSQFFGSLRAQSLLDRKSVVYYLIDTNRDTSTAKDLRDVDLYNDWKRQNMLMRKQTETSDDEGDIVIPQIIVDGVPIGDDVSLQDFEEDADLDWIFTRAACPSCLHQKNASISSCPVCGVLLKNIVPIKLVEEGKILQMYQGEVYNSAEYEGLRFEYPAFGNTAQGVGSSCSLTKKTSILDYEQLFGTPPPEEEEDNELNNIKNIENAIEKIVETSSDVDTGEGIQYY